MKLHRKILLGLSALALLPALTGNAAVNSGAATGSQGFLGVFAGPSFVNNGGGTNINFGARGDFFFTPTVAGGLYISYGNVGNSTSLTSVLAEGNYFLMGDRSLYIGAKLGLGFASSSLSFGNTGASISNSNTNLAVGPAIGYLYPVATNLSAGGELNYLIYTTSGQSTNVLNLLAQLAYHF